MNNKQENKIGKRNFIFHMNNENKKRFKALAARSELTMGQILNDLVKKVMNDDTYEIKK